MATDFQTLLILEGMGILFLTYFITKVIVFVNDNLSKLATYHSLKTSLNINGEGFLFKLLKVLFIYVSLFPLTYFSIYISLKFIQTGTDIQIANKGIITLAPLFTIVFLLLMRVLTNPTFDDIEVYLKLKRRESNFELIKNSAETFKERNLTFFSSFISITLIVFILYGIIQYYKIMHNPSDIAETVNFITSNESLPDEESILALASSYFGILTIFTFLTEMGLALSGPIIQTPWKIREAQKPLTVETFETFGLSTKDLLRYRIRHMISDFSKIPTRIIFFIQNLGIFEKALTLGLFLKLWLYWFVDLKFQYALLSCCISNKTIFEKYNLISIITLYLTPVAIFSVIFGIFSTTTTLMIGICLVILWGLLAIVTIVLTERYCEKSDRYKNGTQNSIFSANEAHHGIIFVQYQDPRLHLFIADSIDLLVREFDEKIPFKVYPINDEADFAQVYNNPSVQWLWILGHGERRLLSFLDDGKIKDILYENYPAKSHIKFIAQLHCNPGGGRSLIEINNLIPDHDITKFRFPFQNRCYIMKKTKEFIEGIPLS
jgi:hypothetical protein